MPNPIKVKKDTGSKYSQSVNINMTDIDMTLEFIYIDPFSSNQEVVSTITLPIEAASQITELIQNLLKERSVKNKDSIKARS